MHRRAMIVILLVLVLVSGCVGAKPKTATIRLGVSLTPQELATFQSAIAALDAAHPEWEIILEPAPQSGVIEKTNAQLAANELPDVIRVQGLMAQQWIRKNAFLDLSERIKKSGLDLTDFYSGPQEQFRWQSRTWGLPDSAAPDVVYYNKDMFDAAGLSYPTDDWSYEDMRRAAIRLTRDASGRSPGDPSFDAKTIRQWGWNGALTFFWQRHLVRAFGGEWCVNDDCTQMTFTSPEAVRAAAWWASLTNTDRATLYDPYGGSQTGAPGDPFIAGKAAMGYNGFFAVGQLNDLGGIRYDIVQPLKGADGRRYTTLSTTGYVISAKSKQADAAWALVQVLLDPAFLRETWGKPGHAVPARRSAADSVINPNRPPVNQRAIIAAMEYGEVFKPYTSSAFEVYAKTGDLFLKAMKGEMTVEEAMKRIEVTANEVLARDRTP